MTGEILRAVLEETCLWSRPAFYGDHQTALFNGAGGAPPTVLSGIIRTRPTSFFLCTSIAVSLTDQTRLSSADGLTALWAPYNNPFPFTLTNQATGKPYNIGKGLGAGAGGGMPVNLFTNYPVSPIALPTYIYLPPQQFLEYSLSVTQITVSGGQAVPADQDTIQVDVLLQGIEYQMPGGSTFGQAA